LAIDITKAESHTEGFLAKNPKGQVPVIELDDGRCLAQSNAILRYLAQGSHLLPTDAFAQAKVDEWLFWEQYSHEPYIAVCRYQMVYLGNPKASREPWRVERGEQALETMNAALECSEWLAGEAFSIADIALVAYTRLAHEGGFDLAAHPHVTAWISRCEGKLTNSL
jgi:glutathione S-transferase